MRRFCLHRSAGNRSIDTGATSRDWRTRAGALVLCVLSLIAIGVLCSYAWPAQRSGDGVEYLAMSMAFVRHGTPEIRPSDVRAILERNRGVGSDGLTTQVGEAWITAMKDGASAYGLYPSKASAYFSYHFWFYSLANALALYVLMNLAAPVYSSFLVTNGIFLIGLCITASLWTTWRLRRRVLLVALCLTCGSTFYLGWTGPEIMCFALVVMGLIFLESRHFGVALACFAFAAQQNPPIGFLAIGSVVLALRGVLETWKDQHRVAVTQMVRLVPGAVVLIVSPLFYLLEYGTSNLIAKMGGASASFISAWRYRSLFLDANQGMIVAMPGLFVVLIALLVIAAVRHQKRVLIPAVALIVVVMLMAVPVLTTTNWNAGEVIISRYAYWLSAPLIYACALLADGALLSGAFSAAAGLLIASQVVVLALLGVFGSAYFYVDFSPIATRLMERYPRWYSPVPEIFAERGTHVDGALGSRRGETFALVYGGYVRSVLFDRSGVAAADALCNARGSPAFKGGVDGAWAYRRPGNACPLAAADGFYAVPNVPKVLVVGAVNELNDASSYVSGDLPGISNPEDWGVWTNGQHATLPVWLPAVVNDRHIRRWRVTLSFHPFVRPDPPFRMQHVTLLADGAEVFDEWFTSGASVEETFVTTVRRWGAHDSLLLLTFRIPTARFSYHELGLGGDVRRLGIGLTSIRAVPAISEAPIVHKSVD